jgi:hypothetical protein
MLQEDAQRFVDAAQQKNPLDPSVPLGPLIPVLTAPVSVYYASSAA